MTSKSPRKKYFTPKKPVNKMTEVELDEFAKFIFDNLMGDLEENNEVDDQSVDPLT